MVVGIDVDEDALDTASENIDEMELESVALVRCDVSLWPAMQWRVHSVLCRRRGGGRRMGTAAATQEL